MDTVWLRLTSLLGVGVFILLAWTLSENRKAVRWRTVAWGLGLQFGLGILVLRTAFASAFFSGVQAAFDVLTEATAHGAGFVFGKLVDNPDLGMIFAFQVLPVIILVSSLSAVLIHLRIIPCIVNGFAWLMQRTMKTSGVETVSAAMQVFAGIESMPALRPYYAEMTRSELCTVMTTFMASIAASVMVAYASFGAEPGHLLAASIMSAPAAILVSKLLVPEMGHPKTDGTQRVVTPIESHNIVDAAARGAADGLQLALNVGAMLIAFIGLVFLADLLFNGVTGMTFAAAAGWLFRPFAYLMGVPLSDVAAVGGLLGKKTVLNEFLAYADLKPLIQSGALSPRGTTIATYALCGFANPGSLAILIGACTTLMPQRRTEIVELGLKSFLGGTLSCFITAAIAGILT